MSRRSRQLYLGSIIIASLIVLPTILLYSSGYLINIREFELEETGTLIVSSVPKDSSVYIEETNQAELSPTIINLLKPGKYTVSISKNGYSTWRDQITISAHQSTILESILLFRTDPESEEILAYPALNIFSEKPEKIQNFSPEIQYSLSELNISDNYKILSETVPRFTVLDKNTGQLYLLDANSGTTNVKTLSKDVIDFHWNTESNILLYYTEFEIFIYNPASDESHSLLRQSQPIREAIWHPRADYIIFSSGPQIKSIETRMSDSANTAVLFHGTKPQNIQINKKGAKLYITEDDYSRYELTIQ